jgi:flagellar hook-basal body complex protein FliE
MIEKATSATSIASMLKTLQTHSAQASGMSEEAVRGIATPKTDFSEMIRQAVSQTNDVQMESQKCRKRLNAAKRFP